MPKHLNPSSTLLLQRAIESGITSRKELANLMGNADVETRGFQTMHEDHRYRSANSLIGAVSSAARRFSHQEIEEAVASHDPKEIFKVMYENKADLGNNQPGDGYKYHGRGYLQYTGRYNYTKYGDMFGVDLKNNPDIAAEPEMAAKLAIAFWKHEIPQHLRENVNQSARIINGGDNGKEARVVASHAWEKVITPQLIEEMKHKSQENHSQSKPSGTEQIQTPSMPYQRSANDAQPAMHTAAANHVPDRYASLHAQVGQHIERLYNERGIDWGNGGNNTVAACTVACVNQKVTDVQHANVANGNIHLGQKNGFEWNVASIDATQAARTPQRDSFAQLAALEQQQSVQQDNLTQQQTQARKGPSIG